MKSLEQRMNRFSWACAAMLVMGGIGASGQAMAATCTFVEHRPGAPHQWGGRFDLGVIRIDRENSTPRLGEPLSEWVEVSGTLNCEIPQNYQMAAYVLDNGQPIVSVQMDGGTYATVDSALPGEPPTGVGFIAGISIGNDEFKAVSTMASGVTPGPRFNNTFQGDGDIPFRVRRRAVGLGVPIPEGEINPHPSMLVAIVLFPSNSADGSFEFTSLLNATFVYQVASCAPTSIDQDVDLGAFSIAARPGVGQPWSKEEDFDFTIACPSSSTPINVHALFTDNATPTNTGSALTLTGASIPTGVELRLFQENDTPITFGPESADPDAQGAFDLFTAPANVETTEQVTFKARLFQTQDTVGEGEINAAARVTLTYD